MRQPLEDKCISISRAEGTITYPADCIVVATCNPCPCGYHNSNQKDCVCSPAHIRNYQKKISGPIIDRIDMWIYVEPVQHKTLFSNDKQHSKHAEYFQKVSKARHIQHKRFGAQKLNSSLGPSTIKKYIDIDPDIKNILDSASRQLHISARSYHKILKIARTIADIDGEVKILEKHVLEALQYRQNTF